MLAFIFRRLLSLLFVLFCVITLTFFLVRLTPGGPFDRERKIPPKILSVLLAKYHLDMPEARARGEAFAKTRGFSEQNAQRCGEVFSAVAQYSFYLQRLARGDLLISTKYLNRSVNELLAQTLPVTATLGALAFCIATLAGVWLGCWAAVRHHTPVDTGAMFLAVVAVSVPTFVIGPLLILLFAIKWQMLPVGGWGSWPSLVLPAVTLASPYVAAIARLVRTSMLEVLGQDFVRTARAKGLTRPRVIYKHALKVAILPVVSFLGPLAANLLTGSIVVETIFNIPGAGGFFVNSILNKDGFLLEGVVIVYCVLLVLMNLVVDIAYGILDPRIKIHG
jgi:oligopeptide transport system permease protein